jgi:hypothetical protein
MAGPKARLSTGYRPRPDSTRQIVGISCPFIARNQNTGYNARHEDVNFCRETGRLTELPCVTAGRSAKLFLTGVNARNPLKSPDSDEKIRGNPSKTKASNPTKTG